MSNQSLGLKYIIQTFSKVCVLNVIGGKKRSTFQTHVGETLQGHVYVMVFIPI